MCADIPTGQLRSRAEFALLGRHYRGIRPSANTNGTLYYPRYVDIPMATNAGNRYLVRLFIPMAYPDKMPDMVVANPKPLLDYWRRPLVSVDGSMHVLSAIEGCTQLCHFSQSLWDASLTLLMVALKGGIWLEAYEGHRRTGNPLDHWITSR
jgi:hypothetical protein